MAGSVDDAVVSAVMGGMTRAEAAAADSRIRSWDHLAVGTGAMWTQYLASPSILAAIGFRTAQQSAGFPADKGTGTGGT